MNAADSGNAIRWKCFDLGRMAMAVWLLVASFAVFAQDYVLQVAAGGSHTCALVAGGRVKCWGYNAYGQLGNGSRTSTSVEMEVVGLPIPAKSIALGRNHSCALAATGRVLCWGANFGTKPVTVGGLPADVAAIAAGAGRTCALTEKGSVPCWDGYNDTPSFLTGLPSNVVAIALGEWQTAVISADGRVWYWGLNGFDLDCPPFQPVCYPVYVYVREPKLASFLPPDATAIAIGGGMRDNYNLCALVAGGRVTCWGGLNNHRNDPSDEPELAAIPTGVTALAMGYYSVYVLANGGTAYSFGTAVSPADLPPGLSGIAAGSTHACAFRTNGEIKCWGSNSTGALGDGTTVDSSAPITTLGFGPAARPVTAVEYYHRGLDHYFLTWMPEEIALLDVGQQLRGWTRTGAGIDVFAPSSARGYGYASTVCRFYIPPDAGDSHFYGRSFAECDETQQKYKRFQLETWNFMEMLLPSAGTCPPGTTPVYRVFSNRPDTNHRYTTNRAVRNAMVEKGWLAEGDGPDLVVMCAPR